MQVLDEETVRAEIARAKARHRWLAAKQAMRLLDDAWLVRHVGPPPSREFVAEVMEELWAAWEAFAALGGGSALPPWERSEYRKAYRPSGIWKGEHDAEPPPAAPEWDRRWSDEPLARRRAIGVAAEEDQPEPVG